MKFRTTWRSSSVAMSVHADPIRPRRWSVSARSASASTGSAATGPRVDTRRDRTRPADVMEATRRALTAEQIAFLYRLSPTVQIGRVLFCHATPRNDLDIFTERTPEERVAGLFAAIDADVVVCGHTHTQFQRTMPGRASSTPARRQAIRGRGGCLLDVRPRTSPHPLRR
jgi:hypothetical protein